MLLLLRDLRPLGRVEVDVGERWCELLPVVVLVTVFRFKLLI